MAKTIVINQPFYLPWLGYFELINRADVFVILDTVQFVKQSWQSRNRLKDASDQPYWLSVPLETHDLDTNIAQIRISRSQRRWQKKHLGSIQASLGGTDYYTEYAPLLNKYLAESYEYLVDLNEACIRLICDILGIDTTIVRASQITHSLDCDKTERVVAICKALEGTFYYSPRGSADYMETDSHLFEAAKIEYAYQDWEHPTYPQKGHAFVSHLSAIDALMNCGAEKTKAMLEKR